MAKVLKRCGCPEDKWAKCPHSWTVRYWVNGGATQKERSLKGSSHKAAVALGKKLDADTLAGTAPPKPITFGDYAAQWLDSLTGAPGTKRIYESALRRHLTPVLGYRQLTDVAADREGVTKLLKSLSAGVRGPAQAALSGVMSEAERSGRVTTNRLRAIRLDPPVHRADPIWATYAQLAQVVEAMGDLGPAIWIMRGTGVRPGEVLALRKADFINGHLRIARQRTRASSDAPLKARTADEYRDVPCPGYVRDIVDKMPDGPLFGKVSNFNKRFRKAADAAGLKGFRPHDLRHLFASVTLAEGVQITDLARWLGHRNIQVTYATYSHFIPSSFGTAKAALDTEYERWSAAA